MINTINTITKKKLTKKIEWKLKKTGINKVNSMSYKIKNTHIIEKLKFICIFTSEVLLKPHS